MKINQNKLKIKYILGIYKDLPSFPTIEDIMYDLVESNLLNDKDIQFTDQSLMKKYPNLSREDLKKLLDKMIENKWLSWVKDTDIKSIYQIKDNPFEKAL